MPDRFPRTCRICARPHGWRQIADGSEPFMANFHRRWGLFLAGQNRA
jgi:hypothetical protein